MAATKELPEKQLPAFVKISVPRALHTKIVEMAESDRRTLTATVEIAVENELERRQLSETRKPAPGAA